MLKIILSYIKTKEKISHRDISAFQCHFVMAFSNTEQDICCHNFFAIFSKYYVTWQGLENSFFLEGPAADATEAPQP
jgi:hypothetical protein